MSNQANEYDPNMNYQLGGGSDSSNKLKSIQLPDLAGKRFLDLGCNAGFFCAYASSKGASHVLGVDNSPTVISAARERHPNLSFLDTGWDKFPDGEFDVVICLSAIHYASNQIKLAKDIWAHLSPHGLFVLEGGLVGEDILKWTDLPVVSFREVADKVRHLSTGFVSRHMLVGYDWRVLGPSVMQGGDPIPRFVIHARKNENWKPDASIARFRLCPVEYSRAISLCAQTIQPNQPSYQYVRDLGHSHTLTDIVRVLSDSNTMALFADDVAYALKRHGTTLELRDSLGDELTSQLAIMLADRDITVIRVSASNADAHSVMRRMEAGVEFSSEGKSPGALTKILGQCALSGARVADLSGPKSFLWKAMLDGGVAECHVLLPAGESIPNAGITAHAGMLGGFQGNNLDLVYFDSTLADEFDHVDDVERLADVLKRCLASTGQAYVVLRTGIAQSDWDVYNQILMTPIGRLPSSDYLYNVLLREFAVRPLIRVNDDKNKGYSVTRVFRVAPRQPTLMVVIGHSQAGKTTLARRLRQIPDGVHFSSDYLFYELFRLRTRGALPNCSQRLLAVVGGGSAEEVGNFFRAIEDDTGLFHDYLKLMESMIPRTRNMISLDLDLRIPKRIDDLRRFFSDAGFSVWIVTR